MQPCESSSRFSDKRGKVSAERLQLDLLGTFRLRQGDRSVACFEHAHLQHLLAYLALYRLAPISRQQLAFLFWPDSTDQQALRNLRTLLTRLRHALPDTDQMTFLGLQGMIDPARLEVKTAVAKANHAGLRCIMITGDYKDTAANIAGQIGMLTEGGHVVSGGNINEISDDELDSMVLHLNTCARSSPEHKICIVDALNRRHQAVAITGDGANDAPALKRADIGVAMGITGTDVTKQTADMVLTNDNFASIVSAIEEGRIIYSNIRKFVFFLISCNIGEILIIFLAMLAGLPPPLSPVMLLFLNLVSDGAPALALGMEKGEPGIMDRPPRPVGEPIINREMLIGIAVQSVVMTMAVIGSYLLSGVHPGATMDDPSLPMWQTVAFATLTLSELIRAFTARSERISVFKLGVFSNKTMNMAVIFSIIVVIAVIYVPFLNVIFGTVPLVLVDWLWILPFALMALVAAEITKVYLRGRAKRIETTLTAQMELA